MRVSANRVSRRMLLAGAVAAALATARPARALAKPASPTSQPSEADRERIRKLEEHYAKVYGEPLTSTERLGRQIAIVSLSRIDAAPITARLLDVFTARGERDPVIAYLAWEALHARHASLNADQRRRWATGGLKAAVAGAFPGPTVTPLLRALAEHQPT